jgi:hypothetical protein
VDLKLPIEISDELEHKVIKAKGMLDLASGEVFNVEYLKWDVAEKGLPWKQDNYEFSCGVLENNGKAVEFTITVDQASGQYSVSATELLEVKARAAALFSGKPAGVMLSSMNSSPKKR